MKKFELKQILPFVILLILSVLTFLLGNNAYLVEREFLVVVFTFGLVGISEKYSHLDNLLMLFLVSLNGFAFLNTGISFDYSLANYFIIFVIHIKFLRKYSVHPDLFIISFAFIMSLSLALLFKNVGSFEYKNVIYVLSLAIAIWVLGINNLLAITSLFLILAISFSKISLLFYPVLYCVLYCFYGKVYFSRKDYLVSLVLLIYGYLQIKYVGFDILLSLLNFALLLFFYFGLSFVKPRGEVHA